MNARACNKKKNLIYTILKIFPLHARWKYMLNDMLPTWQCTKFVRHEIHRSLNHGGQGLASLLCSNPPLLGSLIARM
jgi:hypothetical protein